MVLTKPFSKTAGGTMCIKFRPELDKKIRDMAASEGKSMTQLINELCYASLALGELEEPMSEPAIKATILPGRAVVQIPVKDVVDICFSPNQLSRILPEIKRAYSEYLEKYQVV